MSKSQSNQPGPANRVMPVTRDERYLSLDVLRGLSLFGVLLVNDLDFFRVSLFDKLQVFHTHSGWQNRLVDVLVAGLFEFKAFTLFSFLFGAGIGIQTVRLEARHAAASGFLSRRLAVLLGFGLMHMFFISNVDILCLYACCGLLLIPILRCSAALLAIIGVGVIALKFAVPVPSLLPSAEMMGEHARMATSVYATGAFDEMVRFRWHETWHFIVPLLLLVLPQTFGLMLLGMAASRAGIVQEPDRYRRCLVVVTIVTGSLGAVMTGLDVFRKATGRPFAVNVPAALVDASSYLPLAVAYASAVLLWVSKGKNGKLTHSVAAIGQMALTNYLLQSVILGLIFYSYGLGLFGRMGSAPAAGIGMIIYLGQLLFSRMWLKHYRFGPAEWLWRSLTYGEWQPMRHTASQVQPTDRNA